MDEQRLNSSFLEEQSGSIALLFALFLPILLAATAGTTDYVYALREKSNLQSMVDAAALDGAKELSLSNAASSQIIAVVQRKAESYAQTVGDAAKPKVTTELTKSPLQVSVSATQQLELPFRGAFGFGIREITAKAVAQVVGQPNICVLTLARTTSAAIDLKQSSKVTGDNCSVFSNSTSTSGIMSKDGAYMEANTICSAGGVSGGSHNFDPFPYMDCPTFEDPLANRPEPAIGSCNPSLPMEISTNTELSPGTYCGLVITNGATVRFQPGVYIIKDQPLVVKLDAKLIGEGVGFYLSGPKARVQFLSRSSIELSAPTSGEMAGLLIFASRSGAEGNKHRIQSKNAQKLVGTIYAPTGELSIDGDANVGNLSAYTAIVVEKLVLFGGPHVKLNTNYSDTDVPVPDGIKGAGQPITLVE